MIVLPLLLFFGAASLLRGAVCRVSPGVPRTAPARFPVPPFTTTVPASPARSPIPSPSDLVAQRQQQRAAEDAARATADAAIAEQEARKAEQEAEAAAARQRAAAAEAQQAATAQARQDALAKLSAEVEQAKRRKAEADIATAAAKEKQRAAQTALATVQARAPDAEVKAARDQAAKAQGDAAQKKLRDAQLSKARLDAKRRQEAKAKQLLQEAEAQDQALALERAKLAEAARKREQAELRQRTQDARQARTAADARARKAAATPATAPITWGPKEAAKALYDYLRSSPGDAQAFGSKRLPNPQVARAQKFLGVTPDGIVGPQTQRAAARQGYTLPPRPKAPAGIVRASTPTAVETDFVGPLSAQQLAHNMASDLAATRNYGSRTRPNAAVRAFQRAVASLVPDGIYGAKTREAAKQYGIDPGPRSQR